MLEHLYQLYVDWPIIREEKKKRLVMYLKKPIVRVVIASTRHLVPPQALISVTSSVDDVSGVGADDWHQPQTRGCIDAYLNRCILRGS